MAVDEPGQDPVTPQDSRLMSLDERLRQAERVEGERTANPSGSSHAVMQTTGLRLLQSLVGMPLGGALIGWLLDRWLNTAPWIMLGLLFLGFAGAVLDVMKSSKRSLDQGAGK